MDKATEIEEKQTQLKSEAALEKKQRVGAATSEAQGANALGGHDGATTELIESSASAREAEIDVKVNSKPATSVDDDARNDERMN